MKNFSWQKYVQKGLALSALLATVSCAVLPGKSLEKKLSEKYGYEQRDRLFVDENKDENYFVKLSYDEFISQMDSLVQHSDKEEAFIFLKNHSLAVEFGINERSDGVTLNLEVFEDMLKEENTHYFFHTHVKSAGGELTQKICSTLDIQSYIDFYAYGLRSNGRLKVIGNHVSVHGVTTYGVPDKKMLFDKKTSEPFKKKDMEGRVFMNNELNLGIEQYLENKVIIKAIKEKKELVYLPGLDTIVEKKYFGYFPIDMKSNVSVESKYFYIEFAPTISGRLPGFKK